MGRPPRFECDRVRPPIGWIGEIGGVAILGAAASDGLHLYKIPAAGNRALTIGALYGADLEARRANEEVDIAGRMAASLIKAAKASPADGKGR